MRTPGGGAMAERTLPHGELPAPLYLEQRRFWPARGRETEGEGGGGGGRAGVCGYAGEETEKDDRRE